MVNFDGGFSGVVLAMPSFNNAFGSECKDTPAGRSCVLTATEQSLLAIPYLFQAIGGALAGILGAYVGRRVAINIGCLVVIVGAAVMIGIDSYAKFLVGKCISGVGLGLLLGVGIVYGTECIPASQRGALLSVYNVALAMGNVVVAAVCVGSSKLSPSNALQWKTPVICQIPIAVLLAALVWFFPESPRWLLATKSNPEQASKAFARFYRADVQSEEVDLQMAQTQLNLQHDLETKRSVSWLQIYSGTNFRRTVISGFILTALAICGIQFALSYATVFLQDVGISNVFVVNLILGCCILAGTLLTPWCLEYLGCRGSFLVGFSVMSLCMLIFAAVASGLGSNSSVSHTVLVVFLCLWAFTFGAGIGSAVWLASAEMHSVRLRTYGQASSATVYQIFGFAATFWTPYMLQPQYGNWGTNVGYFYFAVNAVSFVLTFIFVPETAKLTLEQIDEYFASGVPAWKTSVRKNKKLAKGE
ncbi:hypothetical protein M409DRAFT_64013 [Zasmidium cellare ATCC 36951]|uniref:Major facilitator superfamily (MFS) profile domain-containing protein n=1 Tax=Zasmidium cellare ATCC 36951 TaxID=1080233 RepID=A0A6A6CVG5_ZASCE|nr:uncharacterized protein M409DRAFT_64013 [Zasmidium cellare ATCC 36951]KAF2171025.1 hypothetical protein M409DRAFT_64013 [Zasmidium cellare ATCC 36951]